MNMRYYPLNKKIACKGIKPTKAMVYTLAAEIESTKESILSLRQSLISALMSYDHYDYYDYYDYYYDYDSYYYYYYDYDSYSKEEKVIYLLLLANISS